MDGYNFGNGSWRTFDQIFSASYSILKPYNKPMMIAEFACATDEVYSKASWITDAFSKIENSYPKIRIFNWFNIKKYEAAVNKIVDWKVDSSTDSLDAFKTAISDDYFIDSAPTE